MDKFVDAAAHGNIDGQGGIVYWLYRGIPIDARSSKESGERTAFLSAVRSGQYDAAKFLYERGADINVQDAYGMTPLAWAVTQLNKRIPGMQNKYIELTKFLIEKKADGSIRDKAGLTVLHHAANGGNTAIIYFLLDHGYGRFINDTGAEKKGRTPLAEAVRASRRWHCSRAAV